MIHGAVRWAQDYLLDVLSGTGRAQLSSAKRSLSLGQLVEDLESLWAGMACQLTA